MAGRGAAHARVARAQFVATGGATHTFAPAARRDTKFCYFNNSNVNQPRYYCKVRACLCSRPQGGHARQPQQQQELLTCYSRHNSPCIPFLQTCQRYWTAGGTLRNVPPGSGRRKSKSAAAKEQDKQHQLAEQLAKQSVANAMLAATPASLAAVPFLNPSVLSAADPAAAVLAYNATAPLQQALLGAALSGSVTPGLLGDATAAMAGGAALGALPGLPPPAEAPGSAEGAGKARAAKRPRAAADEGRAGGGKRSPPAAADEVAAALPPQQQMPPPPPQHHHHHQVQQVPYLPPHPGAGLGGDALLGAVAPPALGAGGLGGPLPGGMLGVEGLMGGGMPGAGGHAMHPGGMLGNAAAAAAHPYAMGAAAAAAQTQALLQQQQQQQQLTQQQQQQHMAYQHMMHAQLLQQQLAAQAQAANPYLGGLQHPLYNPFGYPAAAGLAASLAGFGAAAPGR